jgi:hypothetical protein
MATDDFFRARLDGMVDPRHPLAVLAGRMPWSEIEAALAPTFDRKDRKGRTVEGADLFGPTLTVAGAGVSAAGRPRLPIRPGRSQHDALDSLAMGIHAARVNWILDADIRSFFDQIDQE